MKKPAVKKAIGIFLACLLVANMVVFGIGLISPALFWAVIIFAAAVSYRFFRA